MIPADYPLRETPSSDPAQRTAWNVRDSDATLVIAAGALAGGTALTVEIARRLGRALFVADLAEATGPAAANAWLQRIAPETLNVAGPRESESPGIGARARSFLAPLLAG